MSIDISDLKTDKPWYDGQDNSESVMHYGTPRHSGRYPYGSGDNPYQHASEFRRQVEALRKEGKNEKYIADYFHMTVNEYRSKVSNAKAEIDAYNSQRALKLRDHGYSKTKIAEMLGVSEGTVRNYLKKPEEERVNKNQLTADKLKAAVDEKGMIDVGKGVERILGVSNERLDNAIDILKEQGYVVDGKVFIQQATDQKQFTTLRVLAKPGTTHQQIVENRMDIQPFDDYYTEDGGKTWYGIEKPVSIDSKRIYIRYGDDTDDPQGTGKERDGLIQLRRGVDDISLNNSLYAQVRIGVDDKYYMKGIAVYSDDIPEGYDIVYNSNKPKGSPKEKVFKPMQVIDVPDENGNVHQEIDWDNPFGALITRDGQHHYDASDGSKKLSVINKVRDEGEWDDWSRNLPTQFLGKQNLKLIDNQLKLTMADKKAEFEEIMSLDNPTIKKKLLMSFADDCDKSAVDLKAKSLPNQAVQVLLPDPNVKETEIYAPNYQDGSYVALIRYPHGGTFEIPILKVNNEVPTAKKMLGDGKDVAIDAVVINAKTASKLSGADFDGDTVTVIPTHGANGVKITSQPALKGLEGFDPSESYPYRPGMDIMTKGATGKQMGVISNLITDMTIKGASPDELARAVRHSMVVIDAAKHKLDYKQSYQDNCIRELQLKYQGKEQGGASTLFSRAKSQARIDERKEGAYITDPETGRTSLMFIDPNTGEKLYSPTGNMGKKLPKKIKDQIANIKNDPDLDGDEKKQQIRSLRAEYGVDVNIQQVSTKMAETNDAHTLSSGHPKEKLYADFANSLKDLANKARLETINIPNVKRDPVAAQKYKPQVESLNRKINEALLNAPRERAAQVLAFKRLREKLKLNPSLESDTKALKKTKTSLIIQARAEVGAKGQETRITITDAEWEAIQNKAISNSMLETILAHTDEAAIRKRATPRTMNTITPAKEAKIKALIASGFSTVQIAESMSLPRSTIINVLKQDNKKGENND